MTSTDTRDTPTHLRPPGPSRPKTDSDYQEHVWKFMKGKRVGVRSGGGRCPGRLGLRSRGVEEGRGR